MKKFKIFFIAMIYLAMFTSCDDSTNDSIFDNDLLKTKDQIENLNAKNNSSVTIPFKAIFYTKRDYSMEVEGATWCTEDPFLSFNYQVGEGEATHLGYFQTTMWFCGAPDFTYANGTGTFVAANGDELYVAIPSEDKTGEVIPIFDHPFYEAYFVDPFTFIGGTGRFEGATGGGWTNSFVDLFVNGWGSDFILEHRTDHEWTGTLTIVPGSRSN